MQHVLTSQPPVATGRGPDLAQSYRGARVLITGGLGLIGSIVARRLVGIGARVTIIDTSVSDSSANLQNVAAIREQVQIEPIDVRATALLEPLLARHEFLFNLAGQSSHTASMADPMSDHEVNSRAQLALLEAARAVNPDLAIVFASTRQIYGRPRYLPVDENHPLLPVDVNGIDKRAGESFHLLYNAVYGLKTTALRLTNTYGPGMRIKDARQTFIGIWLRNLIEQRPFEVWGGAQKRDFTYVDDAAEAFLLAAVCTEAQGHAFNIGGDQVISLSDLAALFVDVNGGGEWLVRDYPDERRRIDIGDYYADDRRFRALTGWRPRVPLRQGVQQTLSYFRENLRHYV